MTRVAVLSTVVLVVLSTAVTGGARAQAEGVPDAARALSLEGAIALARGHSPVFLSQRNDVDVSEAAVRSAYGDFLPSMSLASSLGYTAPGVRRAGSVVLGEQPSIYSSSYSLGASYQVSGARLLQPSIARAELRATRQRVAAAEANLVNEVTQQFLAVLQAEQVLQQTEREIGRADEYLRLARTRAAAGAVSVIEVKRAEVQQGQAEIKRLRATSQVAAARLNLGRVLGVRLEPATQLVSEFRLFEPRWDPDSLIMTATRNHISVGGARAAAHTANLRIRAARAAYLPSLSLSVNYNGWVQRAGNIEAEVQRRLVGKSVDPAAEAQIRDEIRRENRGFPFNYNQQPLSASVGVSIPVFQGFARGVQVSQARAAATDAEHQIRAEELRLGTEVTVAVLTLSTLYRSALLQGEIREKAEEELRLAQVRFRVGAASSLAVTDAQLQLAQAELEEIDAIYSFHKQLASLETLVGVPLR